MAATFAWAQGNGTNAATMTDLGTSGNLFNFKNSDSATAADYTTNPITAGNNSVSVWLKAHMTGTFNNVDNFQFWQSTAFSPATGLSIVWKTTATGATPSATALSGSSAVPTSDPGTSNVGGSLSAAGYSDYIVLQLQTTGSAAAGDTSLATFTLQYDES